MPDPDNAFSYRAVAKIQVYVIRCDLALKNVLKKIRPVTSEQTDAHRVRGYLTTWSGLIGTNAQ
jgi:hypothetical protein